MSAVVMLLMLFGCGDDTPPPFQQYCSLPGDGSQLARSDASLMLETLGKAFYVSDDLVFHLGDRLMKHDLITGMVTQLAPSSLVITDKRYLAIDRLHQVLYLSADNAIYRVGFNGEGRTKLSPEGNGSYSAPALSTCGQHLTAIRDHHIARMEINTLNWIDLPEPTNALYAIYASDENAYYYYFRHYSPYSENCKVGLNKLDPISQEISTLMAEYDYDASVWDDSFEAHVSESRRFFAMQFVDEPWESIDYFFNSPTSTWYRCTYNLKIYDRLTDQYSEIPESFCFAFVPDADALLYSRLKYGMADVMRMDLATGNSSMIWDGYYDTELYSYSITSIFPRYDGEKIHLDAWKRSRVKIDNSKSPTAPM